MDFAELRQFAKNYAEAWCSQQPENVAAFYAEGGALCVNGGEPAVGREAIAEVAQEFMRAFPDLEVTMDAVTRHADRAVFHWTLTGTNTGSRGTGKRVRISGYEEWQLDNEGLIRNSQGHFDSADYDRQLQHETDKP